MFYTEYEDSNNGWLVCLCTCDDSSSPSQDGVTALMMASYHGHHSVVRLLVQAGATINTTTQVYQMMGSCICSAQTPPSLLLQLTANFMIFDKIEHLQRAKSCPPGYLWWCCICCMHIHGEACYHSAWTMSNVHHCNANVLLFQNCYSTLSIQHYHMCSCTNFITPLPNRLPFLLTHTITHSWGGQHFTVQ